MEYLMYTATSSETYEDAISNAHTNETALSKTESLWNPDIGLLFWQYHDDVNV